MYFTKQSQNVSFLIGPTRPWARVSFPTSWKQANHVYETIARRAVTNVETRDGTALNYFPVLKTLENNLGLRGFGKSNVTGTLLVCTLKLRTVYLEDSAQFLYIAIAGIYFILFAKSREGFQSITPNWHSVLMTYVPAIVQPRIFHWSSKLQKTKVAQYPWTLL